MKRLFVSFCYAFVLFAAIGVIAFGFWKLGFYFFFPLGFVIAWVSIYFSDLPDEPYDPDDQIYW